ncbi:MAG TPA: ubiquinone/menaquinone biosynthesis methyltransferase [Actinomycetota bacterium]|nr:ubiquinone/menaquinone biosynthesis methyltransferase [Actinomycetota bacterium]
MPSPEEPLPEGAEKAAAVRSMFDAIAPRYDLVNRVMTFGLDVGWRRRTVRSLGVARGSRVLDIACGTGDLCRALRTAGHTVIGLDVSEGMLRAAKTDAPLILGDALALPVGDGIFDGITCGFALRNVVSLERLFAEMARALRPGGRVALLEVARPERAWLRAGHSIYFNKVVPRIGGLLSDRAAYSYLPRSAAYLPERAEVLAMLRAAGFNYLEVKTPPPGAAQIITGTRS